MEFKGEYQSVTYDYKGSPLITFKIDRNKPLKKLLDLENGEKLSISIKKANNSRSLRQNSLMWAIISDIDKAYNGYPTENGDGKFI